MSTSPKETLRSASEVADDLEELGELLDAELAKETPDQDELAALYEMVQEAQSQRAAANKRGEAAVSAAIVEVANSTNSSRVDNDWRLPK